MRKLLLSVPYLALVIHLTSCAAVDYSEQHLQVVLRDIGHQVLWLAGDSTSRVMPIEKIGESTYDISFQHDFAFSPDSLILVTRQRLDQTLPNAEYIVNVLDCSTEEIFFAFEINKNEDSLIPCIGRAQPLGCYVIRIKFTNQNKHLAYWWLLLLLPLLPVLWWFRRPRKQVSPTPVSPEAAFLPVGLFRYYPDKKQLYWKNTAIELTEKEAIILDLFAQTPNETIHREVLMQALWGEEGLVVVSRNLDVHISKLRKKLQADPDVKISNVHGKGYKLEMTEQA